MQRTLAPIVLAGFAVALSSGPAGAIVYHGTPNLALTSAVIAAGGGPARFSSMRLYALMAGPRAGAEAAALTKQFGAYRVKHTFIVFDYAIRDAVKIVSAKKIALPPPVPSPNDARGLTRALYAAGVTPAGKWDVGYMLERLITHPVHHAVMHDLDETFGAVNNANFHIVLSRLMNDLAKG